MNSGIRIRPGQRYCDLRSDDELTVLGAAPNDDQLFVEDENGVQEIRSLRSFLAALCQGRIVVVEYEREFKGYL